MTKMRHGTRSMYNHARCRCVLCVTNQNAYQKRSNEERASRPIPEHVHGTSNGYNNYKCRCPPCSETHTADMARQKAARFAATTPEDKHGTVSAYRHWGCRCDRCLTAEREYQRAKRLTSVPE